MYIFLDDYRVPQDVRWIALPFVEWTIVRSYDEFVSLVSSLTKQPKFIAFDHDLADAHYRGDFSTGARTGYDCAKFLLSVCEEKNWSVPKYTVHSLNPVGAQNIRNLLG